MNNLPHSSPASNVDRVSKFHICDVNHDGAAEIVTCLYQLGRKYSLQPTCSLIDILIFVGVLFGGTRSHVNH